MQDATPTASNGSEESGESIPSYGESVDMDSGLKPPRLLGTDAVDAVATCPVPGSGHDCRMDTTREMPPATTK